MSKIKPIPEPQPHDEAYMVLHQLLDKINELVVAVNKLGGNTNE